MHVIVVGAGIVGLSTAWAAVKAGHEVTVLEKGPIPNPGSASFDSHRMFRPHYGPQAGYTRMAGHARDAWSEMWADLAVAHWAETGVLAIDVSGDGWLKASREAMIDAWVSFEEVDGAGIASIAPQLALPGRAWGLFAPQGGLLFADRILAALRAWLVGNGARLLENTWVRHVDVDMARVELKTGTSIAGDRVVVAAGAWARHLFTDLGRSVKTVASHVAYVSTPGRWRKEWDSSPALFIRAPEGHLYALPPASGTDLKLGGAVTSPHSDASDNFVPDPDAAMATIEAFRSYLNDHGQYGFLRGAGGIYADTRSKTFIVEEREKALVVTACGGRMFKFGALVGLMVADWLAGHLTGQEINTWAAGR